MSSRKEKSVLITGGSGLIGRYLTSLLLERGHQVTHLSRGRGYPGKVKVVQWDPANGVLDESSLTGIEVIIHLAGENIGKGRWTNKRKIDIVSSRVDTAKLLFNRLAGKGTSIETFISASAIGYYGSVTSERIFSEDDPPADDFLGTTCRLWEEAADQFRNAGIRTVKIRTGVVLEKTDSALSRFLLAARMGVFPVIGTGRQYLPWIHIRDLCMIYLKALEDVSMQGAWNAVSPDHADNRRFVRILAQAMKKPFIPVPIPSLFLKMAMGEAATVALKGSRISADRLLSTGFKFEFGNLGEALSDAIR